MTVREVNWHNIERGYRCLSDEFLLDARKNLANRVVCDEDLSHEERAKYLRKFMIVLDILDARDL